MSISAPATRVLNSKLESRIMTAEEAAGQIRSGDQIGMSGFTGSGYPKAVPIELAHRIADAHFHGQKFQVSVFSGLSSAGGVAIVWKAYAASVNGVTWMA